MRKYYVVLLSFFVLICGIGVDSFAKEKQEGKFFKILLKKIAENKAKKNRDNSWKKIDIAGDEVKNGVGDPSIEYGPEGIGWMSYTRVFSGNAAVHLAETTDHGETWEYVKTIGKFHDGKTFDESGKPIFGSWNCEMSTILYDPQDPGREWKIFYNKYFMKKFAPSQKKHLYSNGLIVYRYTSNPGREWSGEIPLFVMGPFIDRNIPGALDLTTIHSELEGYKYFSELGSVVRNGVIYLSLDVRAIHELGQWEKAKIVLIASRDHGKTWQYRGTLTDYKDAVNFGYVVFTASSIVEKNKELFLLLSPSGTIKPPHKGHDGTYIFRFENLEKAKLKRHDKTKKLILQKHIKPVMTKGGQADYDEMNINGGIILPQQHSPAYPEIFQIFSTNETI